MLVAQVLRVNAAADGCCGLTPPTLRGTIAPMKVTLRRVNDKVHLVAENPDGNQIHIDGADRVGGENAGFRPMQLVLAAIASCTTMDLVPILEKQRAGLKDLRITVNGDRAEQVVPSPFTKIHMHFELVGDVDRTKAERALELAVRKYCSVGEMLKQTVDIDYSYDIVAPVVGADVEGDPVVGADVPGDADGR